MVKLATCRASAATLGRGAVLPDDGVEELVGVGQRLVGRPDRGGPAPGDAVGVAGDPHGEARDHEVPGHGVGEGERAERDDARAEAADRVVARDGGERRRGVARLDQLGRAPADQGQAGPVEEHGGAAVELQGVGPVLERHGARVERRPSRRAPRAGGDDELAQAAGERADADGGEAGVEQHPAQDGGRGQVGHRLGEVAVGRAVREGAAEDRAPPC